MSGWVWWLGLLVVLVVLRWLVPRPTVLTSQCVCSGPLFVGCLSSISFVVRVADLQPALGDRSAAGLAGGCERGEGVQGRIK